MSNKVYLTNEGFLEIEEELNHLKEVKRPEIIKALKDAYNILNYNIHNIDVSLCGCGSDIDDHP